MRWTRHFQDLGFVLLNKMVGDAKGVQTHSPATRDLLSRRGKGIPKPQGHGEKVSLARRGRPQNWSAEGRARIATTMFSKGDRRIWDRADEETRQRMLANLRTQSGEKISADLRRRWATLTPEQRDDACAKRRNSWASLTPEQRARRLSGLRSGKGNGV